ncbi:hypothetical protein [Caballeronia choica]|uniref:hypothetical protein n=1 Tax=Caballeronia choica TaxID=326476 RepID=UPI000AA43A35|nr:hypothetical protein [Caballeronia choica]
MVIKDDWRVIDGEAATPRGGSTTVADRTARRGSREGREKLETKARALATCEVEGVAEGQKQWRDQPDLMAFLRTL